MIKLTSNIAGVLALCWSLTGCGFFAPASLHTNPARLGSCSVGVGRDATIHGSAADPRLAWAIDNGSGKRVELVWPSGYTARFSPDLAILDRDGQVVARDGDLIIGSCLNNDDEPAAIQVDPVDIRRHGSQPGDG
jgi:hypothetical protein